MLLAPTAASACSSVDGKREIDVHAVAARRVCHLDLYSCMAIVKTISDANLLRMKLKNLT